MALAFLGSCLGHCLEHTGHAFTALTKSLYFKGSPWLYAIPPQHCGGRSFRAPNLLYLLKGQLLGFLPELWRQLHDGHGVTASYEPGFRKQ